MSSDHATAVAQRFALTPVQLAVFAACTEHAAHSYAAISPAIWWRAEPPFAGRRPAFATHLRALACAGVLARRDGPEAAYDITRLGERLAAALELSA